MLNSHMSESKHIETKGNCTLIEKGDLFVMTNETTGSYHSISSEKWITSPERLEAHWEGFLETNLEAMTLGSISAKSLGARITKEKKTSIGQGGKGDFCDGSGQLVMHNVDGERILGGPLDFFTGTPSIRLIHGLFATYPEAVSMSIEGQTKWYGEGNVIERRQNAEPCDWWTLQIIR